MKELVRLISHIITLVSGLGELDAWIAAYYCLCTWFVDRFDAFPILNVQGPNGTGKSQLLLIIKRLAYKVRDFTCVRSTYAALRDELAQAHEGTAIMEEADGSKDVEDLLSLRYSRSTAVCVRKEQDANSRTWHQRQALIFGASIIHKREPFDDPALDGRSVSIHTVPDVTRQYIKPDEVEPDVIEGIRSWAEDLQKSISLPSSSDIPEGIAPRVTDTYWPLIALASAVGDTESLDALWPRLVQASQNLRDGQQYEPGPTVVLALLSILANTPDHRIKIRNVKIEGELKSVIERDFGRLLSNRKIAQILRDYGFEVRRIAGPNWVIPDMETLVRVGKSIGLEDDALNQAEETVRITSDLT